MDNINRIIGSNLNRYRRSMGLSLDKVAEMTGVSKGMIGQIELVIIKKEDLQHIADPNEGYTIYPTFKYDSRKNFEVLIVDLEPGCIHRSEAHGTGVEEYIYVCCGELNLDIEGQLYHLSAGDSIKFSADRDHAYLNPFSSLCSIHSVIYYSR